MTSFYNRVAWVAWVACDLHATRHLGSHGSHGGGANHPPPFRGGVAVRPVRPWPGL